MQKQTRRSFLTQSGIGTLGMMAGAPVIAGATFPNSHEIEKAGTYQFTREIPVGDTYDLVVAGGGPAGTAAAISAARLGAKVLLVDDSSINLNVASGLLKFNGIKADKASSGIQAIEMAKNNLYDLIFMDHMMPEID